MNQQAPDLVIGPLAITVHGYQFGEAHNEWDANWLFVTAVCDADGARVRVSGSILSTGDFAGFAKQCEELHRELKGEAVLDPLEPELRVLLRYTNKAGDLEGRVQITPDNMSQRHEYTFGLDQSYLPSVIAQCRRVLERFPVRAMS